ncbi:MAG: hypothetical protein QM696_10470 [Steroidobacteraceae bacterium]
MGIKLRFGWLAAALLGSMVAAGAGQAPAPGLSDMTGVWSRERLRDRPDHFDPNVYNSEDQKPPLRESYAKLWKENREKGYKGDLSYDTSLNCLPKGFPRVMMAPLGMEIMATPAQVNFTNEASGDVVRAFLDDRKEIEGSDPTYMGFTTGRWENGVLTLHTGNLRADTLFDGTGIPHSDSLTVTQKMRFLDRNTLENIVTMSDPKAFTEDWVVRMVYHREPPSRYVAEVTCK